jgi:micrococcal nuclease
MYQYNATVLRWVDGDTVDLRVDVGFRVYMETRFRLNGVDTPERGCENYAQAKEFCQAQAPVGSEVLINTYKADKYGRWLVTVMASGTVPLNDRLISAGLAVPYSGGAKQ